MTARGGHRRRRRTPLKGIAEIRASIEVGRIAARAAARRRATNTGASARTEGAPTVSAPRIGSPPDAALAAGVAAVTTVAPVVTAPPGPDATQADIAAPTRGGSTTALAWISALTLSGAVGLLGMTAANALARVGRSGAEPLFWAGFLLILIPVALRLAARGPSRLERAGLVVSLGVLLYASKVLHDPFAFTYSDELVHLRNAEDILRAGGLFPQNPVLPVTIFYPGLETLTAGMAQLSGLSSFGAGVIVVGAARVLLMLSLFLLFERLSGSARLAGLGALVYAGSPNFLFWSGQYSYQSLAFPLAVLTICALATRAAERNQLDRFGWAVVSMLVTTAIVMTHHLTSYAVIVIMLTMSAAAVLGFGRRDHAVWGVALFGAAAVAAWLLQVAPLTDQYLSSIFTRTTRGVLETAGGQSAPRELFRSSSGEQAAVWERAVGIGSVLLIALVLPFGLRRMWRLRHRNAMLVPLGLAACGFLAVLPLRLVPSAWETANRASDFLFLGVGLTVALSGVLLLRRGRARWLSAGAVAIFVGVVAVGGAVSGWPPKVRLSQPFHATVGDTTITPQGMALSRWALDEVGPGRRFVADESNGRLLLLYGRQLPRIGSDGLARTLLESAAFDANVRAIARSEGVSHVVVDRRRVARDNLVGYYFAPRGTPREGTRGLIESELIGKFDVTATDRLFDSGDVVAYDIRRAVR